MLKLLLRYTLSALQLCGAATLAMLNVSETPSPWVADSLCYHYSKMSAKSVACQLCTVPAAEVEPNHMISYGTVAVQNGFSQGCFQAMHCFCMRLAGSWNLTGKPVHDHTNDAAANDDLNDDDDDCNGDVAPHT